MDNTQPDPNTYDVLVAREGLILGKNTRQCKECGRIYVLRDYVNPCPVCHAELAKESPA